MEKLFMRLSLVTRMSFYLVAALFFIWRCEKFATNSGGLTLTARAMCASLAILLVLIGFVRTTSTDTAAEWGD
jgi:hypothetical protein